MQLSERSSLDSSLFAFLPYELTTHIFSFLDYPSVLTVALVCKHWKQLSRGDLVWDKFKDLIPPYFSDIPESGCYKYCSDYLNATRIRDVFPYRSLIYTAGHNDITIWKRNETTEGPNDFSDYSPHVVSTGQNRITAFYPSFSMKNPCSVQLLVGTRNATIQAWIPKNEKELECVPIHEEDRTQVDNAVTALKLFDDRVFGGFRTGEIKIWQSNQDEGRISYQQTHHVSHVHEVAISSIQTKSRDHIFTGSVDGTIRIWDVFSDGEMKCVQTIEFKKEKVITMLWNGFDGQLFSSTTNRKITIWKKGVHDLQYKSIQEIETEHVVSALLKPHFAGILFAGGNDGTLQKFVRKKGVYIQETSIEMEDKPIIASVKFGFNKNNFNTRQVFIVSFQHPVQCFEQKENTQELELKGQLG